MNVLICSVISLAVPGATYGRWTNETASVHKDEVMVAAQLVDLKADLSLDQDGRIIAISLRHARDEELRQLTQLPDLCELYLNKSQVTDAGVERLIKLERLRTLYLLDSTVTDAGLSTLTSGLPGLEDVYSGRNAKITDDGLVHLKELKQVRSLTLANSPFTDNGLRPHPRIDTPDSSKP